MNELENIKLTFQTLQLSVLKQINLFVRGKNLLFSRDFNSLYWNTAQFPLAWEKRIKSFPNMLLEKMFKHEKQSWRNCIWTSIYQPLRFYNSVQSVQPSVMSDSLRPHGLQHARPPCPPPAPGVNPNSYPFSQWCHPTISSSVIPFSSCLQSFPALGSFQMSQFFTSGGQIIGVSASSSVLPVNIQDWFPLGWTGWISLQSKGLSRVFSNTTIQKHQFFGTQLSL